MIRHKVVPLMQRPMLPEINTLIRWLIFALIFSQFIWPGYGEWKIAGVPNVAPPRLITLACISALLFQFLCAKLNTDKIGDAVSRNWIFFAVLIGYHAVKTISFILDENASFWLYSYMKNEFLPCIFMLFLVIYGLREQEDVQSVISVLLLVLFPLAAIVSIEFILKHNLFSAIVSDANMGTELALADKSRDMSYRAHGSFEHPILLAQYCACMIPLAIWKARSSLTSGKIFAYLAILWAIVCMLMSNTRSGQVLMLFAFILSAMPYFIRWWMNCRDGLKKMIILSGLSLLVIFGGVGAYYWIAELLLGRTMEESHSSWARVDMLTAAIPKILESPIIGFGPTRALDGVGFSSLYSASGRFIDNYFLLVGLQSGLLAVLLLSVMFFILIKNIRKIKFISTSGTELCKNDLLIALASASLIFFVFQIVHASSGLMPLFYMFMALSIILKKPSASV